MVVGVKPDRAVAHPGIQRQLVGQLPARLQIGIEVPHQVALVASGCAFFAINRRAILQHEVFVAFALLAHVFVVKSQGDVDRQRPQRVAVGPAAVDALIVAVKLDHAARMGRI